MILYNSIVIIILDIILHFLNSLRIEYLRTVVTLHVNIRIMKFGEFDL